MILSLSDGTTPLVRIESRCIEEVACSAETFRHAVKELTENGLLSIEEEVKR